MSEQKMESPMMTPALTYGSVCSGIEAASIAWHSLGWRAAFLSEIDAFPRAVLKHHYPETPLHGDFTTIRAGEYEPIDLLVGGTPCQSFSVAGLRGGLDDDRGNLALEYLKLVDRLRPRWVVWENVPGVLSSNRGRDFGAILGGLVELGYGFAYRVLDAQFFGVPQRRRRVFVVGYLGDWRAAAAVLFERQSLQGHSPPSREAGKGSSYDIAPSIGASGRGFSRAGETRRQDPVIAHALRADGFDASEDGTGRRTPIVPVTFDLRGRECGAMLEGPHDTANLRAASGGSSRSYVAFAQNQREEVRELNAAGAVSAIRRGDAKNETLIAFSCKDHGADANEIAPTLRAMSHSESHANADGQVAVAFAIQERAVSENLENGPQGKGYAPEVAYTLEARNKAQSVCAADVRRLTPRECERLQGFPDDYTLIPYRGKFAADGPRYKALGNSMAVPVMRWIGERIQSVESITQRMAA